MQNTLSYKFYPFINIYAVEWPITINAINSLRVAITLALETQRNSLLQKLIGDNISEIAKEELPSRY